jgi:anti-sigma B factor antagonist
MQLEARDVGDVTVVTLNGEITLAKDGDVALRDAIVALLNQGRRKLVLNLAGVTYVDSAGLGQLVQAQTKASGSGARMKVAGPGPRLLTLLKVAKLLSLFDIAESEAAAIETLNATNVL